MASIAASRVPATQPDTSSSHPYTCNTCQVAFRNSELQRGHMRTDWHRYNLKRRVTSLPPIASEVFTEKVLQAQASSSAAATKASYERNCDVCERTYFSENAFINHVASAKHKARLAQVSSGRHADDASSVMSSTFSLGEPVAVKEQIDSDAEEEFNEVVEKIKKTNIKDAPPATRRPSRPQPSADAENDDASVKTASSVTADGEEAPAELSLKRCLFCNYESPSLDLNTLHMERIHGMFIPERSYLVDLEGLIASLHETIHQYHECLYCGKLKPTVFGLQTHMRDKGHCKIPFGTEDEQLEVGEYYDFTSTYSDIEEDSDEEDELPGKKSSGGVKLGARRKATNDDDEEMEDPEGWETDSSESSLDSDDLTSVPIDSRTHQYEKLDKHPHHAHEDPRPHRNKDGFHSHAHKHAHAVFYSEYELHLPSGRTAGHRSLNKYYRQNLHSHPSPAERQEQLAIEAAASSDDSDAEESQVARRERGRQMMSRAHGGPGMLGVTEEKRKEVQAAEKRSQKIEERERRKVQWRNNKQNNSQKHFRDPLLQ
ncbi:C2H2 type zinc finger containing protein [Phlyctema vagabunda]|uniref:C2H2 type zinc finger containing protein n=1 Tax=Phlyctema vagabunda TaxID=108571 RepID=A0ABR4PEH6_9HELO